ncbi:MAG: hypothetical protein ACJ74J_16620 [Blastocatellia bacterium]
MSRPITIILEAADILQVLDALESKAEAYEKTAALMKDEYNIEMDKEDNLELNNEDVLDQVFISEECRDATEAEGIAKHFRDIMASLEKQLGESR